MEVALAPYSVGGKTARACDGCVRRRARWFCAADDAFLCQTCDASVHSANPLARRHQRIRLKTASSIGGGAETVSSEEMAPAWLKGFKRKARTPRGPSNALNSKFPSRSMKVQPVVPDLIDNSLSLEECQQKDQLSYRVPIFDPVLTEFGSPSTDGYDAKPLTEVSACCPHTTVSPCGLDVENRLTGYLPSETELAEFTASMESLLSDGLDGSDDAFCIEKLGLVEPMEVGSDGCLDFARQSSKTEKPKDAAVEIEIDVSKEAIELSFDWESPEDVDEQKVAASMEVEELGMKKKAKLSLDYEAVIAASSRKGLLPWTDGQRPHISLDSGWPDYLGMWIGVGVQDQCEKGALHGDGEREARVSRYREKRRMRLFSKKIRYEVRKLNAEKRPRMKGRFVKRTPGIAFAH